ncbi:MAG: transaldolase [Elusimicrobia bacterium]|nr:transaldolase [Elusimicrobiota bacterium]
MPVVNASRSESIKSLAQAGQSIWLDFIQRGLISSGALAGWVEDGLRGLTSNPAIFEKAIVQSGDYDEALSAFRGRQLPPVQVYEALALRDMQDAADALWPVYERTQGIDGYVSLEVSPLLAHDALGTVQEAYRLWRAASRPNLMIKVPATAQGIPAIEVLIEHGINVNVTLLFSQEIYEQAAWAYVRGLEKRLERGETLSNLASVASFFVSRIDTAIDDAIDQKIAGGAAQELAGLKGLAAIANAKLAYQRYKALLQHPRWKRLSEAGARPQRLLWASTSAKNPRYRDVVYVEELIGPDTVNTVPPATLEAFIDHGRVKPTLEIGVDSARLALRRLEEAGIPLDPVATRLLREAVQLFVEPFEKLIKAIEAKLG